MVTDFDSFSNRGEYLAAHFFAEQLGEELKKGIFKTWSLRENDENDPRRTPRELLRSLRSSYFDDDRRGYFAKAAAGGELDTYENAEWRERLGEWHAELLAALGYDSGEPQRVSLHQAGRTVEMSVAWASEEDGILAVECGWATEVDSALDDEAGAPGHLLHPLRIRAGEAYETGAQLTSWLFGSELGGEDSGRRVRFVLLLCGGVLVLADRQAWAEGRYLAVSLDAALERNDTRAGGELAVAAALFCREMLAVGDADRERGLDKLRKTANDSAAGVSKELRHGLQRSVELIANEVLERLREEGVKPEEVTDPRTPFARQLTRESLRYLYRVLFLLYAEARPELGILPADDGSYEAGYSVARLRELVERDEELVEEEARQGFHLFASLDLLFNKVNSGHRPYGTEPDDDLPGDDEETRREKAARRSEDRGLRFEALRSELFEPGAVRLIGTRLPDPRVDEDAEEAYGPRWLDLRLRNECLHQVLRLLTLKPGRRGERGAVISYRNLGINQLGAVYEGLMSYTGIIAGDELCEVAKGGDPEKGSWLIPSKRQNEYPSECLVEYGEADAQRGRRGVKKYPAGTFVYRLAGRDRETSASYYTPESLTKVTVELTLKQRLSQGTRAAELLQYKICEPALGSGAFLNEAINQVAEEYLRRRQEELGYRVPTPDALAEKQKVKAYIALHNAYGVDLNATGVELAEVSLWLNTMHPGMRAPWFGLHLRRGNSLIGGRRAVYGESAVKGKDWLKTKGALAPRELPMSEELPRGAVHQFLLPNAGWASVVGESEAKALAPEAEKRLAAWKKGILKAPTATAARGRKLSQLARLQAVSRRAEFLWELVVERMKISEREISRHIDVWGADPDDPEYAFLARPEQAVPKEKVFHDLFTAKGTPYWRLKTVMDVWCSLWFWPLELAGKLDGSELPAADDASAAAELPVGEALAPETVMATPKLTYESVALSFDEEVVQEVRALPEPKARKKAAAKPRHAIERRPFIALTNFEDWLDFLEGVLGTADVEEGSIVPSFADLDSLEEYEEQLPGWMGMDNEYRLSERFPWLDAAQDIATAQGFLHWELDFALVFARKGGFDLQVGNPPWVRPDWVEQSGLAEFEPWFALAEKPTRDEWLARKEQVLADEGAQRTWLGELAGVAGTVAMLSSGTTYPLIAGTRPDLYRAFMCRAWRNLASGEGTAGLIHPDTHFNGVKEGRLRQAAYERLRFHAHFWNRAGAFPDIHPNTEFGVQVYGPPKEIGFTHVSWLFHAATLSDSLKHEGEGELPGIKHEGRWESRPHRDRLVEVDWVQLAEWHRLSGETDVPAAQAALLYPVTASEQGAVQALAAYSKRLGEHEPNISVGMFENLATRKLGLYEWNTSHVPSLDEVILQGPHIAGANPFSKQPNIPCRTNRDWSASNLAVLPEDAVPVTNYVRACDLETYRAAQDVWDGQRYTEYFRLTWRRMVPFDTERSLFAALIPPGPAHMDAVNSMALEDNRSTALNAGFWAALPLDYLLRITSRSDLRVAEARKMPAPD
ncbi:hypothetical protein ADK60_31120, partial [Streptomyces sp. XY431]|uniref:hypothetical protein n=1 Tax=Streptomyces sp. XY431 TaxID=1415562 RepID=UPI0006AE3F66